MGALISHSFHTMLAAGEVVMTENGRRRRLVLAAGAAALTGCIPQGEVPVRTARQFHNQPAQSHQHQFLTDLWSQVAQETQGRLQVATFPQNNNVPGSDPQALDMLVSGELEFFTVMGGSLGRKVPVAESQGVPFAFTSHAQVHAANDRKLGETIGRACLAAGIYPFQHWALEDGLRPDPRGGKPAAPRGRRTRGEE